MKIFTNKIVWRSDEVAYKSKINYNLYSEIVENCGAFEAIEGIEKLLRFIKHYDQNVSNINDEIVLFCHSSEIELRNFINNKFSLCLYDENIFIKLILSQDIGWLDIEYSLKFINLNEEDDMIEAHNKYIKERNNKILEDKNEINKKKNGWRKHDILHKQILYEEDIID